MYVCIYVCMYVGRYVCIESLYPCMCLYACMFLFLFGMMYMHAKYLFISMLLRIHVSNVLVYICIHAHICVCVRAGMCMYICAWLCMHVCSDLCTDGWMDANLHMCVHIHGWMTVCMQECLSINMYTCFWAVCMCAPVLYFFKEHISSHAVVVYM